MTETFFSSDPYGRTVSGPSGLALASGERIHSGLLVTVPRILTLGTEAT
jgi:hypothetical protein